MDAFSQVVTLVRKARSWPAGQSISVVARAGVVRVERAVDGRVVDAYEGAPGSVAPVRAEVVVDDRQLELPAPAAHHCTECDEVKARPDDVYTHIRGASSCEHHDASGECLGHTVARGLHPLSLIHI